MQKALFSGFLHFRTKIESAQKFDKIVFVCGMSCGEKHEFALVLDKAGFNAGLVQKIVNSEGNKHAKAMYDAVVWGENKIIKTNQYVKRLSGDTLTTIPACDGSHTLAKAKEVFKYYIDPDFKKVGFDRQSNPI